MRRRATPGRALLAGVLLAGALLAGACSPLPAPAGPSSEQVFEAVKPAVVIVETDDAVTWSVPQPMLTAAREQQLRSRLQAMVRAGQVANTQAAIGQAAVRLLVDSPDAWFARGTQRHEETDSILSLGTGFFITQDGYLLTNDHVVELPADEVRQELLDELHRASADPAQVAAFRDEMSRSLGVPFADDQAARLFQWMVGVFTADLQVASVRPSYRIGFGSTAIGDIARQGTPVQLVAHGATSPGRDVAVLRAAGGPYVSLTVATAAPAAGAALSVVGYPCRCGDDGSPPDLTHVLTPVLTQGTARERVPMSGGWTALGTDAHIERGNSGGPVLDGAGDVVGLATFTAEIQAGVPQSFAVPIDVASQLARQAHVRPVQGTLGKEYAQAVSAYQRQRYSDALPLFRAVAAHTHDGYAQRYVLLSERAIARGEDRTLPPLVDALPAVAGVLAGAVLATLLALGLLIRLRTR
ncbi:MAG TPA: S1C family serine protease [Candidatus Dormibacteraeota bacterium]|nr:S1C family serine protease [Candidatus Dormibacteraeota bacterium]